MSIFQRRIPLDPPELAAMVIGAGVLGPAAQKFAKEFPAIVAVTAFNAAIPANASTFYQKVLAEVSAEAPDRKTHMDIFVFANLTGKAAKLAELDKALFAAAAIAEGINKEAVASRYDAVLKAAQSPGEALVRKAMEQEKTGGFFGRILKAFGLRKEG